MVQNKLKKNTSDSSSTAEEKIFLSELIGLKAIKSHNAAENISTKQQPLELWNYLESQKQEFAIDLQSRAERIKSLEEIQQEEMSKKAKKLGANVSGGKSKKQQAMT